MMTTKILITGTAGFIGFHLAKRLVERGDTVVGIDFSSPVRLMEYIPAIENTIGREAKKEFLPMKIDDVPRIEADVTDLIKNLGYKPNTPVQKGIEKFIQWYKSFFMIHSE